MLRLVTTHDASTRHPSPVRLIQKPEPPTRPQPTTPTPDPRWAFAARVATHLEGGHAAILRPERRERLLRLAAHLRLRPFDAALIIAMVQDTARRGEAAPGHAPLSPQLADRLAEALPDIPATHPQADLPRAAVHILQRLAGATIIAAAMVTAAILWLHAGS